MLGWVIFFGLLIIMIIILLLFSQIKIYLIVKVEEGQYFCNVYLYINGIKFFSNNISIKLEEVGLEKVGESDNLNVLLRKMLKKRMELVRFLKKIQIRKFKLNILYGSEDPFYTACFKGSWEAFIKPMIFILSRMCKVNKVEVEMVPSFNKSEFKIDFSCIILIRIVHIIRVVWKMLEDRLGNDEAVCIRK